MTLINLIDYHVSYNLFDLYFNRSGTPGPDMSSSYDTLHDSYVSNKGVGMAHQVSYLNFYV